MEDLATLKEKLREAYGWSIQYGEHTAEAIDNPPNDPNNPNNGAGYFIAQVVDCCVQLDLDIFDPATVIWATQVLNEMYAEDHFSHTMDFPAGVYADILADARATANRIKAPLPKREEE